MITIHVHFVVSDSLGLVPSAFRSQDLDLDSQPVDASTATDIVSGRRLVQAANCDISSSLNE
jgi:hypothetical protein